MEKGYHQVWISPSNRPCWSSSYLTMSSRYLWRIAPTLFRIVDPTSKNRQGNDQDTEQIVYYVSPRRPSSHWPSLWRGSKKIRQTVSDGKEEQWFRQAEDYHQDYLRKHPNGYCHPLVQSDYPVIDASRYLGERWGDQKVISWEYAVTQKWPGRRFSNRYWDRSLMPYLCRCRDWWAALFL